MPDDSLPYGDVLEKYKQLKAQNPGQFDDWTLPQYAQTMNQASGSGVYNEGLNDSLPRRVSEGIDYGLNATGIPQMFKHAGEATGGMIGPNASKMFGSAFEQVPRMAGVGAVGAGLALSAPAWVPEAAAGALGMGLATGADAYLRSGSAGQGLFQGTIGAAGAGLAGPASQWALKGLGGELTGEVLPNLVKGAEMTSGADSSLTQAAQSVAGQYTPVGGFGQQMLQKAGSALASQGAFGAVNELGSSVERKYNGSSFLPTGQEFAQDMVGQIPFAAFDVLAPHIGLHKTPEQIGSKILDAAQGGFSKRYADFIEQQTGQKLDTSIVREKLKNFLAGVSPDLDLGSQTAYESRDSSSDSDIVGELMGKRLFGNVGDRMPYVDAVREMQTALSVHDPALQPDTELMLEHLVKTETEMRASGTFDPAAAIERAAQSLHNQVLENADRLSFADPQKGLEMRQASADHVQAMVDGKVDAAMVAMKDDPNVAQALARLGSTWTTPDNLKMSAEQPGVLDKQTGRMPQASVVQKGGGIEQPPTQYSQSPDRPDRNNPEVSAAAQRAAYTFFYNPETGTPTGRVVDWNNPESVKQFDNYAAGAMKRAETSSIRQRAGEGLVPGLLFNPADPKTFEGYSDAESAAHSEANRLNAEAGQGENDTARQFVATQDRKGNWRVADKRFDKTMSLDRIQEERDEASSGLVFDGEQFHEATGDDWTGEPTSTDEVTKQLDEADGEKDPAIREAKKDLLITNLLDMVDKLSDEKIRQIFAVRKTAEGLGRFRTRLYRYLQFLSSPDAKDFKLTKSTEPSQAVSKTFDTRAEAESHAATIPGATVREGLSFKEKWNPNKTSVSDVNEEGKKETLLPEPKETERQGYRYSVIAPTGPKINRLVWDRPEHLPPGATTPMDKLLKAMGDSIPEGNKSGNMNALGNLATNLAGDGGKLNFFETMEVLMKELSKGFQNPKDLTRRPIQLKGFLPPGIVSPPIGFILDHMPKVWQTPEHQVAQSGGPLNMVPHNFTWVDKEGKVQKETGKSTMLPSERMTEKLRQSGGTMSTQEFVRQFVQDHGDKLAPEDVAGLRLLANLDNQRRGYVDMPIGFALPTNLGRDNSTKGLYVPGGGVMMTTYKLNPKGKVVLDAPQDMAPHIVHELAHAATQGMLANDPGFKGRVQQVMKTAKSWVDNFNETNGLKRQYGENAPGFIDVRSMRSLSEDNADEFMAEFMQRGSALQTLLHKIPDDVTQGAFTKMSGSNMFNKLWSVVKEGFSRVFGAQGQTLADRVRSLMEESLIRTDAKGQEFSPKELRDAVLNRIYTDSTDVVQKMSRTKGEPTEPIAPVVGGFKGGPTAGPADIEAAKAEGAPKRLLAKHERELSEQQADDARAERLRELERQKTLPKQPLESRQNLHPDALLNALKWSADDVEKEQDGSITFKPLRGLSLADVGSRFGDKVRISPQDQQGMLEELTTLKAQGQAESALAHAPVATSAFQVTKAFLMRRGWPDVVADKLAATASRMSLLFVGGKEATVLEQKAGQDKASGVAFIGHDAIGLSARVEGREMAHIIGHEVLHIATDGPVDGPLADVYNSLGDAERRAIIDAGKRFGGVDNFYNTSYAVSNSKEFWAELAPRLGVALAGVSEAPVSAVKDMFVLGSQDSSALLKQGIVRMEDVVEALKQQADPSVQSKIENVVKNLVPFVRTIKEIEKIETAFHTARNIFPDSYKQMVLENQRAASARLEGNPHAPTYNLRPVFESRDANAGAKAVKDALFPPPDEKLGWWNRIVGNFFQVADEYPVLKPIVDVLMAADGMANTRVKQVQSLAAGVFQGANYSADARSKEMVKFVSSKPMKEAYSKVAQEINKDLQAPPSAQQLDTMLSKYLTSPEDKKVTANALQTAWTQNVKLGQVLSESWEHGVEVVGAKMTQAVTRGGTSINDARQATKLVRQAYELQRDYPDELKPANVVQQINDLREQAMRLIDPANPTGEAANTVLGKLDKLNQLLIENEKKVQQGFGWWTPERRFGDFSMLYNDKESGKIERWVGKTKASRDAFIQQQGLRAGDIKSMGNDEGKQGNGKFSNEALDSIDDTFQRALQKIEADPALGKDVADMLAKSMDVGGDLRAAMLAKDITNPSTPRKFAFSRKYLDMHDVQQDYIHAVIYAAKNRFVKGESDLVLGQPAFDVQPDLKNYAQQHISQVLKPDTDFGRMMSTVNFTYFMGMNLGTMVMEPFQQLMMLAPVLTKNGATLGESYKHIGAANLEWTRSIGEGGFGKGNFKDPDIQRAMEVWREKGQADAGITQELNFDQDLAYMKSIKAAGGIENYGLFDMLKNKAYSAAKQMQRFYMTVPSYNSEIALIAAYKMSRAKGLDHDAAVEDAARMKSLAMITGGRANRPVGLFALPRTIAQTMYSLQSYSTAMLTMMGSLAKQSFVSKGLTSAQQYQIRLAAGQMIGTQMIAGGVLGMPFVAAGIAALQKMFPDMNVEASVRDFLGNIDKHDDGTEGLIGNMLARGVPNAFSMGPDFSSRFQLGGTIGVSPYTGVDASAIFGPTGSLVHNILQAGQAAKEGNVPQTVDNLLPTGFRNLWHAAAQGSSSYDAQGRQLVNDLTTGERMGKAIGMEPNRVSALKTGSRLAAMNDSALREQGRARDEKMATLFLSGQGGQVAQTLQKEASESGQDYASLAKGVANKVEEKTMPLDPRMQGSRLSAGEQQRLIGLLGHDLSNLPTMTDRELLKSSVLSQLGVPTHGGALRQAAGQDYLMQQTPGLVRQQAMQLLSHARHLDAGVGATGASE